VDFSFSDFIKELRGKLRLSQSAFAKRLNLSIKTIQGWEYNDNITPEKYSIQRIITEFLLTEKEYPKFFEYAKTLGYNTDATLEKPISEEEVFQGTATTENSDNMVVYEQFEETTSSEAFNIEATEIQTAKPQKVNFKEKLKKLRFPFFIGVGVWIVELLIIAAITYLYYTYYKHPIRQEFETAFTKTYIEIDYAELVPAIVLLFIITIILTVVIYSIIKKIIIKRKNKQ